MENAVCLTLPYPVGCGGNKKTRFGGGHAYTPKRVKDYFTAVASIVLISRAKAPQTFGVRWRLYPPDKRARDSDNALKTICDALTRAGFWVDDSNRHKLVEIIEWAEPIKGGKVEVEVWQMK